MLRRAALVLALVCGGFWVIGTLAMDYPEKFQGGDDLTDTWRPVFTDQGLAQARTDIDAFAAFSEQFQGATLPALAQQLGMTPAEFTSFAAANFPATSAGVAGLGEIVPFFDQVVSGLEANQDEFRLADAIPTKDLPATTVPWILIILGLVAAGAAVAGLARPHGTATALAVTGAVGVVAIVASLLLSVPAKSQAVEDITDDFRTTFSVAGVAQARQGMDTVTGMANELGNDVIPALATALGATPEQLTTSLATQFPAVGTVLGDLPALLSRFEGLVSGLEGSAEAFGRIDSVPTQGTAATLLEAQFAVPGVVLVVGGGVGLALPVLAGRRRRTPDPEQRQALAA